MELSQDSSNCNVLSQRAIECSSSPAELVCFGDNAEAVQLEATLPTGSYKCNEVVDSANTGGASTIWVAGTSSHKLSVEVQKDDGSPWTPVNIECPQASSNPPVGVCSTEDFSCSNSMSCAWAAGMYVCGGEDYCHTKVKEISAIVTADVAAQWSRPTDNFAGDPCAANAECRSGVCVQGTCRDGKQANGGVCSQDHHCESNSCVNGVCSEPFVCGTSGATCPEDECGFESAEAEAQKICCPSGETVSVNLDSYCSNLSSMSSCLNSEMCASGACGLYGWEVGAERVCCGSGKTILIPDATKTKEDHYCTGLPTEVPCYMVAMCSNGVCGYETFADEDNGIPPVCCPSGKRERVGGVRWVCSA